MTQKALATKVGLSRSRLADVEAGRGAGLPLETWFALADALGIHMKFEFARDPLEPPADAGHLDIQQLILRLARGAGFDDRQIEMPERSGWRWTDVALIKRAVRRLVLVECVNTFGDIGASFRSSDRKVEQARQLAATIGGEGSPFVVGLVWVVRDTLRNRALLSRYEDLFAARFTASSRAWIDTLTKGSPPPAEPGLVWCNLSATRIFEWRHRGTTSN